MTISPVAPAASPTTKHHPNIREFREWPPQEVGHRSVLDELSHPWAQREVATLIRAIVDAEAPIHRDRLTTLVAGAYGLRRVTEDRRAAIERAVPAEFRRDVGDVDVAFYWPPDADPATWRVVRLPGPGRSRALDQVSLVEIGNAMIAVTEQAGGIGRDELKHEAFRLFGGRKLMPRPNARLERALELALTTGRLASVPDGPVTVPAPRS
ncbi:DUF3320 domain-containing protein [Mycobacterium sp. NPDC003449]